MFIVGNSVISRLSKKLRRKHILKKIRVAFVNESYDLNVVKTFSFFKYTLDKKFWYFQNKI